MESKFTSVGAWLNHLQGGGWRLWLHVLVKWEGNEAFPHYLDFLKKWIHK